MLGRHGSILLIQKLEETEGPGSKLIARLSELVWCGFTLRDPSSVHRVVKRDTHLQLWLLHVAHIYTYPHWRLHWYKSAHTQSTRTQRSVSRQLFLNGGQLHNLCEFAHSHPLRYTSGYMKQVTALCKLLPIVTSFCEELFPSSHGCREVKVFLVCWPRYGLSGGKM